MDRYKNSSFAASSSSSLLRESVLFRSDSTRERKRELTTEKMSGVKIIGGGGGGKKSYNGVSDIPSGSRKMVQSLKEIVNCPEAEIYAVLKDCNMDPNEAVNRLLSQGLSFFFLT